MSMFDAFLEVSYQEDQATSMRNEMAEAMMSLPTDMLHKLASGEEKLASFHDEGGCWLDQFSGTPHYDQAIQLEEQSIKLDAESKSQSREEDDQRNQIWDAKDGIRLKKRMLELDLRKAESGGGEGGEEELEIEEPEADEESVEAMKEGSALRSLLIDSMHKEAQSHQQLVASMRKMAEEEHQLSRALLGLPGTMAMQAAPGQRMDAFKKGWGHTAGDPMGGLKSMGVGGGAGAALGGLAGMAVPGIGPRAGATAGGFLGVLGGSLKHGIGRHHGEEGSKMLQAVKKKAKKAKGKEKKSSVDLDVVAAMRMAKVAGELPEALKKYKVPEGTDLDEDGKKNEGKKSESKVDKDGKEKSSAMIAADQWGRKMAHMSGQEKVAFGALLKSMGAGLKAVGGAARQGYKGLAAKGGGALKQVASGPVKPGMAQPMAQAAGGFSGAARGAGQAFKGLDPKTQMALVGTGAGVAGLGAGAALS